MDPWRDKQRPKRLAHSRREHNKLGAKHNLTACESAVQYGHVRLCQPDESFAGGSIVEMINEVLKSIDNWYVIPEARQTRQIGPVASGNLEASEGIWIPVLPFLLSRIPKVL